MNNTGRAARPFSVTIICLAVLYVATTNLLRMVLSIQKWDYLVGLLDFSPAYLTISGLVWGVAGIWLVWGVWRSRPWARSCSLLFFLVYSIYFWLDRLMFPGSSNRNSDWTFYLTLQVVVLIYLAWVLTRKKTRIYFGESYER